MSTLSTNILNQVFDTAKDYNGTEIVVALLRSEENQEFIIHHLNNNLQIASTRNIAFHFINELFAHFTYNNVKSNAILWLNKCLDLKVAFKREHFNLITNLFKQLDQEQEFRKYVTNCMAKIIEHCLVINSYVDNLICLEVCMEKYSSTCFPYKLKIEEFLFNILTASDNYNISIIRQCGRCFHFLQQVGGGGIDSITHKTNWSTAFKKLCSTVHNLYDTLFDSLTELNDYEKIIMESYEFPVMPSSSDSIEIYNIVANRLNNIIICLQSFLESKYPVAKNLSPQMVLDLIKRGLAVHNCSATNSQFVNEFSLKDNIIKIQINILGLFRSFIACLHNNAVPYSTQITKLLLDNLLQMKRCNCFDPYSKYITNIYKVFTYWIVLMKNKLDMSCHNKLIAFISEQVKPEKSCLHLTIQTSGRKKQSNKKSKQAVSDTNLNLSKRVIHLNTTASEIKCINALKLLDHLFANVSLRIGREKFAEIYNMVTSTLMNIQSGNKEYPYTNRKCEEYLYNILLSFFEQPFTIYSPPFDLSLNIFLNGKKSQNTTITVTCFKGVNVIEKFAQAIYPTLYISSTSNNAMRISNGQSNGDTNNSTDFENLTEGDVMDEEIKTTIISNDVFTKLVEKKISKRSSNSLDNLNDKNKKLKSNSVNEEKEFNISTFNNESSKQNVEGTEKAAENFVQQTVETTISEHNSIAHPSGDIIVMEPVPINRPAICAKQSNQNAEESLPSVKTLVNGDNAAAECEDDDMLNSFNDVLADK